jgi:hypothetical protein
MVEIIKIFGGIALGVAIIWWYIAPPSEEAQKAKGQNR